MGTINVLGRLGNLWKGFISLWISDVEKRHPEIAYQNAIDSMVVKYTKLKTATASIIRRRQEIESRLQKEQSEYKAITTDLDAAISTNQDDLAVVLIQKKNALEASIASLQADMDLAQKDADDAKSSLLQVKNEIGKLKAEKDRMLAKMQTAQARVKIQEQLEGLSVDAEVQALENVREHIKTTIAEADLGKELRDADLDVQLSKLRQSSGAVTAKQELEAMKKARSAAKETASKRI